MPIKKSQKKESERYKNKLDKLTKWNRVFLYRVDINHT